MIDNKLLNLVIGGAIGALVTVVLLVYGLLGSLQAFIIEIGKDEWFWALMLTFLVVLVVFLSTVIDIIERKLHLLE